MMRNINRTRSPDQIDFPDINQVVEDNFRDTDGNLSWANAPRYNLRALNNIWDSSYLEVLPIWKGFLAKTRTVRRTYEVRNRNDTCATNDCPYDLMLFEFRTRAHEHLEGGGLDKKIEGLCLYAMFQSLLRR
jgi:hypothetical protein